MSHSIAELHAMTDEEVIAQHDRHAVHTTVGTDYWMSELERRSRERATVANTLLAAESHRLAKRSYRLTWMSSATSIVALVVAIIAIFAG